jgi:hypothetical protein
MCHMRRRIHVSDVLAFVVARCEQGIKNTLVREHISKRTHW